MTKDIHEQIRAVDDGSDRYDVADQVLATYRSRADVVTAVRGLVADQVMHQRRARTRVLERDTIRAEQPDPVEPTLTPVDPLAGRYALLNEKFYVNDEHGDVRWGEATAEHHRLRVEYLRGQQQAIEATVQRHELAIRWLEERAATCLNELGEVPQ